MKKKLISLRLMEYLPVIFSSIFLCMVQYGICCDPYSSYEPVINTHNGYIKGKTSFSRNGRRYTAFRGIPYAQPPVGNLRFSAPKPAQPWNGTLDCTKDGPVCIQKNYLFANPKVEGQEDCLYLNVYVPEVLEGPLPILMYIHWSGFFAGRGTSDFHGPKYIMDKNVILVTFNYRLGIFGFLSSLDDEAPGNYGLKDQVAAMRWVQKNIRHFNGDPERVTLFGASAGSGSVHLHMLSPYSKGLFHQAISESGSALALWATPLNEIHKQVFNVQAQISGCNKENSKEIISCLRKVDAKDLVESGDAFKYFNVDPLTPYTLVTEKKTEKNPEPFLTKLPIEYIRAHEFSNIPWIVGWAQNEGNLRASHLVRQTALRNAFNANFTELMLKEMYYAVSVGLDKNDQLELHNKAQKFYMNGQDFVNIEDPKNIQGFINLWSDRSVTYPSYQSVMLHTALGHNPIWVYNFGYRGEMSYESLWAATNETIPFNWGASHCDELLYIFDSPSLFSEVTDGTDRIMSEIILDRFTNFVVYGSPQSSSIGSFWHSLNFSGLDNMKNEHLCLLNITGSASRQFISETMQTGYNKDRMMFWSSKKLFENFEGLN